MLAAHAAAAILASREGQQLEAALSTRDRIGRGQGHHHGALQASTTSQAFEMREAAFPGEQYQAGAGCPAGDRHRGAPIDARRAGRGRSARDDSPRQRTTSHVRRLLRRVLHRHDRLRRRHLQRGTTRARVDRTDLGAAVPDDRATSSRRHSRTGNPSSCRWGCTSS